MAQFSLSVLGSKIHGGELGRERGVRSLGGKWNEITAMLIMSQPQQLGGTVVNEQNLTISTRSVSYFYKIFMCELLYFLIPYKGRAKITSYQLRCISRVILHCRRSRSINGKKYRNDFGIEGANEGAPGTKDYQESDLMQRNTSMKNGCLKKIERTIQPS